MCDKRLCACGKKSKPAEPVFMHPEDERVKALEEAYAEFSNIESNSLLKKHLTQTVFDRLKIRTTSFGSTLMDVIQSGLKNPDSGVGLYAPDQEAYDVFADLFDPVIDEYHNGFKSDNVHPALEWGTAEELGDLDPEGEFVISTRIRCARSVKGYPLNPTMTEAHYRDLENKVRPVRRIHRKILLYKIISVIRIFIYFSTIERLSVSITKHSAFFA